MTTAERIIVGVVSLIALIGWLQHPTSPPKYQRPSNDEQIVARSQTVKWLKASLRRLYVKVGTLDAPRGRHEQTARLSFAMAVARKLKPCHVSFPVNVPV
jgi:hypothetical protein